MQGTGEADKRVGGNRRSGLTQMSAQRGTSLCLSHRGERLNEDSGAQQGLLGAWLIRKTFRSSGGGKRND